MRSISFRAFAPAANARVALWRKVMEAQPSTPAARTAGCRTRRLKLRRRANKPKSEDG
jgi:hypothetical protein